MSKNYTLPGSQASYRNKAKGKIINDSLPGYEKGECIFRTRNKEYVMMTGQLGGVGAETGDESPGLENMDAP